MTMKAWVLHGPDDLRFEDVAYPGDLSDDSVIMRVKACGICGSDIPRIFRTGAHRHPLIPGHEFSGEVVETGSDELQELVGRRFGVFPLIPCKKCSSCLNKKYEMCIAYDFLGSRSDGAFTEYVKVPVWNLIELPETVSYETAAMMEPMAVAVHAMRQAGAISGSGDGMKAGSGDNSSRIAVVIGLGTIGLLLSMFLKKEGFRVIGVANKPEPAQHFNMLGFPEEDFIFEYDQEKRGERLKKVLSAMDASESFIFECVGTNDALSMAVSIAPPGAHLVTVGNPASDMALEREVYWKILRRQLNIHGTWNSSFTHEEIDDWHYVLDYLSSDIAVPGRLISHRMALDDLMDGLLIMRDKKEYYTKIVYSA